MQLVHRPHAPVPIIKRMNKKIILFAYSCFCFIQKLKLRVFIFPMLLFAGKLYAQPGGGGGLGIVDFYSSKLDRLDISSDTSLKIRTFSMLEGKLNQERYMFQPLPKENGKVRIYHPDYGTRLPPTDDRDGYSDKSSIQRMYIVYQKDTMIIDFYEIIGENGAGRADRMDSLVIQRGYFKFHRSKKIGKSFNREDYDRNVKLLKNGLTFYTVNQLSNAGYIEYNPTIDISFLLEKNLSASYFFERAKYYLKFDQPKLALEDIEKGIEKNNGQKNCETLYLLCDAYNKAGQYKKAIESVSQAILCKCYGRSEDWEAYWTRIDLFIKLKKYNRALEDFNTLLVISEDKQGVKRKQANFKMKYLKDYKGAISDLKTITDVIPDNHMSDGPLEQSEYSDTYFDLAYAEYLNGDKKSAFRHWLKAEEFGYSRLKYDSPIIFFDSIITRNPQSAEIYLARSIAFYDRSFNVNTKEEFEKYFNDALADICKASESGMKDDYRISMYRASVLIKLNKYDEAMKEIDKSILKNNTDPRCYLIRYGIREKLGQAKLGDKSDPDLSRAKLLLKNWKWEKY